VQLAIMTEFTIRELKTFDDCRAVTALEREVWGYTDSEDVVPPPVLIVSIKRGGILLGGFDRAGAMKGFVYSIPAIKDGQLTQWSHMLGVTRDVRQGGLGLQLKRAQRDRARAMGIALIEWTFDPLQVVNASLNFTRLGVIVEEYEENIYGESSSPLHQGSPTDRFVAEWHLNAPHVERRITSGGLVARDQSVAAAPIVNPSIPGTPLRPGTANLSIDDRRMLVEIPAGFAEIQAADPTLAHDWRLSTRAIFQHYFHLGYRAVDFFHAPKAARGHYLLALPN
jgi:predicted GNAT superfamily acetyltransferase